MPNNYRSFTSVGQVILTALPQNLDTLFPGYDDSNVWGILFEAGEENGTNTYIYIGDHEMTATGLGAGRVLRGPLDKFDLVNQNSQNSLDPSDFFLFSSPAGGRVRVIILTS